MTEKYAKFRCGDFAHFDGGCCEGGVLTLHLASWDQFPLVVNKFREKPVYYWRGQSQDWPLVSSFDRGYKGRSRDETLQEVLKTFRGELGDTGRDATGQELRTRTVWAIGQHYGLPTPLLDWTDDPYIAAYFAFRKAIAGDSRAVDERVVYALNRALTRLIHKPSRFRFVEYVDPELELNDRNRLQNERLERQKGRFTEALNGIDIERNVATLVSLRPEYSESVLLAKILIPEGGRERCLVFLEFEKSITSETLLLESAGRSHEYAHAVEACASQIRRLMDGGTTS